MSDDLIRRSDAIKAVWGDDINPSEDGMVFEAQSHIDRDIRLIPSADRPQGEWIKHDNERDYCSRCKYIFKTRTITQQDKWTRYIDDLGYNFCPNCGARMKGADGEAD